MAPTNGSKAESPAGSTEDEEREKKRGAAAPPWASEASPEAGGFLGRGAARAGGSIGRGAARPGWGRLLGGAWRPAAGAWTSRFAAVSDFLTSNAGLAALAAAVVLASAYGLLSLRAVRGDASVRRGRPNFSGARIDRSAARGLPTEEGSQDSVAALAAANRSPEPASGGAAADVAAEASAPPADAESAVSPSGGSGAAASNGGGAAPAAPAAKPADAEAKAAERPRLALAAGGLAGGGGMSGGFSRPFDPAARPAKEESGKLAALPAAARPAPTRTMASPLRTGRKGAFGQLQRANAESGIAKRTGFSEGQSYHAAEAFGGGPAIGGGSSVGGEGAGVASLGGAGAGTAKQEGPLSQPAPKSNPETPPSAAAPRDVSPWTSMLMLSQSMLMIASLIIMVIGILSWGKAIPQLKSIQLALFSIATGLAAAATVMGLMIATTYGQTMQGAIIATGGAITTAAAVAALAMPGKVPSWVAVLAGVAGLAASVWGLMARR